MTTKPTMLILGGEGFVGSAVTAVAAEKGYTTIPVGRSNYDKMVGTPCDVLVNANGNSRKYLARKDRYMDFELSVASVARSIRDFQPGLYLYLSSSDVYSDVSDQRNNAETAQVDFSHVSPYGFHKHLSEEIVRHAAPNWLILRMAGFVGNGLWKNSIHDMLTGNPVRVDLDSTYQYLNSRDLALILLSLLADNVEREIVNVAGDGVISLADIGRMIGGEIPDPIGDAPSVEQYEINIDKLRGLYDVPKTLDTVTAFIEDVKEGRAIIK